MARIDDSNKVIKTQKISRDDFLHKSISLFAPNQTFAFEACGGSNYIAQELIQRNHKVILLRPKDVKPHAKIRQKNDINDAIAICKAAADPDLKHVHIKTKGEQEVAFLHKTRQNIIQQRIQRTNALGSSLHEFGYIVKVSKAKLITECGEIVNSALKDGYISDDVAQEMLKDCKEIKDLQHREKEIDAKIRERNKNSEKAKMLLKIPGIGPINASILSNKPMHTYKDARDFAERPKRWCQNNQLPGMLLNWAQSPNKVIVMQEPC